MTTQQHTNYLNGLDLDVLKETVGAIEADGELGKCRFRASNKWIGAGYNCTTVSDFYGAGREMSHAYEFEMH
ncbi:MAG: OsmC family peroxiredoxin, partial [Phycisphaerae bacterium]|nr:OsmC family peroxiredoxin [Phycisphaerae bacterium]